MEVNKQYILKVLIFLFIFYSLNKYKLFSQINYKDTTSYLLSSLSPLSIPTYDGSNQLTHPDIIFFPNSFNSYNYWLAFTPYPFSNNSFENPSVVVSNDSYEWVIPDGLINPIVDRPNIGYNADPDIIFNKNSKELWLYYIKSKSDINPALCSLNLTISRDGINWSKPIEVLNYVPFNIVSPTIVCYDSIYMMWSVNAGKEGWISQMNTLQIRKSCNGIVWSEPDNCILNQPNYVIWHTDVIYIQSFKEYWMLFAAYQKGEKANSTILFFAKSIDGYLWETYERPLLNKGENWDSKCIYRATSFYNEDTSIYNIYYSAINMEDIWKTGHIDVNYIELNNILTPIETSVNSIELLDIYYLSQNYPNPFNNETVIRYKIIKREKVTLEIYSIFGKLVRSLINNETRQPGEYEIKWDGKNNIGIPVSSGIYFYNIKSKDFFQSKKMVLLR